MNRLAFEFERKQKHGAAARSAANEALAYAEKLGSDDFRLAVSLNDRALLYLEKENSAKALPFLLRAEKILKGKVKIAAPAETCLIEQELASVQIELSGIAFKQKKFEKSLQYCRQASDLLAKYCGLNCREQARLHLPLYVDALWSEAEALLALDRKAESLEKYRLALAISEAEKLPQKAKLTQRCLSLCRQMGNIEKIVELESGRRWLDFLSKAKLDYGQGRYASAAQLFQSSMQIADKYFPVDLRAALSAKDYAHCLNKLSNRAAFEKYELKALSILEKIPNAPASFKDSLIQELYYFYRSENALSKMQNMLERQLVLRRQHYPMKSFQTLAELAALDLQIGKRQEAGQLALQSIDSYFQNPSDSRASADSLVRLADVFDSLADRAAAEKALKESVKIVTENLKLTDSRGPVYLYRLAEILSKEGKEPESKEAEKRALAYLSKLKTRRYLDAAAALEGMQSASDPDSVRRQAQRIFELSLLFYKIKDLSSEQISAMKSIEKRMQARSVNLK